MIRQIDLVALRQALAIVRAGSEFDRTYVETHLADERWDETARNCAVTLQERNLGLRPWELAPASIRDIDAALDGPEDHRGVRAAAQLLQRMRSFGISRYAADPVRAVASAEQAAALENK